MSEQDTAAIDNAPQEATPAPETGTETQGAQPDVLSQLNDRLSRFESGFDQRFDQLAQNLQPQEDPYQQDPYAQPYEQQDPYGGLDPNDPAHAQILQMRQEMQQVAQSNEQLRNQHYNQQIEQVFKQYPQMLEDPKVGEGVSRNLAEAGYDINDQNTRVPPALLVQAYKAFQADQYAAQQQSLESQQSVSLEQGGAMQQSSPDVDPADEFLGPKPAPTAAFGWARK